MASSILYLVSGPEDELYLLLRRQQLEMETLQLRHRAELVAFQQSHQINEVVSEPTVAQMSSDVSDHPSYDYPSRKMNTTASTTTGIVEPSDPVAPAGPVDVGQFVPVVMNPLQPVQPQIAYTSNMKVVGAFLTGTSCNIENKAKQSYQFIPATSPVGSPSAVAPVQLLHLQPETAPPASEQDSHLKVTVIPSIQSRIIRPESTTQVPVLPTGLLFKTECSGPQMTGDALRVAMEEPASPMPDAATDF